MSFTPEFSASLPGPEWLRSTRARAIAGLSEFPFPSPSQELWRYSRVEDVVMERYQPADTTEVPAELADKIEAVVASIGSRAALVVTVDGLPVRVEVVPAQQANVQIDTDASFAWEEVGGPVDHFGALNAAFVRTPVTVGVKKGKVVSGPVVIVHLLTAENVAAFPRTLVRAEEASEVGIYEIHLSADVHGFVAPVVHFDVQPAANVRYVNVEQLGSSVHHVGYNFSRVDKEATFDSLTVALGGDYSRFRTDSHLVGAGGDSKLRALYFGTQGQQHDFRTLQAHEAPKTTSDLFFKGAVGDVASSVYSGLIRVDKGAAGTNAFQTNRNLVLSSGARAESVPNLEIEESDVKCSHASAVGPIDEEQRYYLESRGVPTDVADRLIALGFLAEVLQDLRAPDLRDGLTRNLEAKLGAVGAWVR